MHRAIVLGRSVDGRAIVAVETGDTDSPRKTLVVGCIHGDEPAGIAIADRLVRATPPPETDIWVVRDLNPDGTAAATRGNAHRVDLNRNFHWRWQRLTGVYDSGPRPLSEPESRIAYALIGVVSAGDVAPSEAADRFVMAQPPVGSARLNAKHVLRATAARSGERAFAEAADQLVAH